MTTDFYDRLRELKDMAESILGDVSEKLINKEHEMQDLEEDPNEESYDEDCLNNNEAQLDELRHMEDYLSDLITNLELSCENNIYV